MQLPRLTYDQSKRAKTIGFDWPTEHYYYEEAKGTERGIRPPRDWNNETFFTSAPENALFLQWCREVKQIHGYCYPSQILGREKEWYFELNFLDDENASSGQEGPYFSHIQSENALIDYLLDLLEKTK